MRIKAYLQLFRIPNLVTSAGDVLAGIFIVSSLSSGHSYNGLYLLLLSTIMLYAGGVALNDAADAPLDSIERPERPIPSGKISRTSAFIWASLLLAGGALLAGAFHYVSLAISVALVISIVLYNLWAKKYAIPGTVVMALCRFLNLWLGFSFLPEFFGDVAWLALLPFSHIIAVTALSRGENHGYNRIVILLIGLIHFGIVLWLIGLGLFHDILSISALVFIAFYALAEGYALYPAISNPKPESIKRGVKFGILSLLLLNAAIVAIFDNMLNAFIIAVLLIFSLLLARTTAMT